MVVERSTDGAVVRVADAALGHRGPLFGLVGGLTVVGYGCALLVGAYVEASGHRGEVVSVAYVLAWAVVFAAWRAWWGTMASHEVFRIGGGLAQIGGEIVTAAALGDPRVIPPGRADDAPADDGELDCRGQTEPLRLRRSFAVVFGRDPDPVVVVRCITRFQAAEFVSAITELLRE